MNRHLKHKRYTLLKSTCTCTRQCRAEDFLRAKEALRWSSRFMTVLRTVVPTMRTLTWKHFCRNHPRVPIAHRTLLKSTCTCTCQFSTRGHGGLLRYVAKLGSSQGGKLVLPVVVGRTRGRNHQRVHIARRRLKGSKKVFLKK